MRTKGAKQDQTKRWASPILRTLLSILTPSLLMGGCGKQNRAPLIVEDVTPIVGVGRVTTEALGIETLGGVFTRLIEPGTTVPCSLSEIFSTAANRQTKVTISIFRGTNEIAASNHALGWFQIVNIPPERRGMPRVEVTFTITEKQILISARDLNRKADLEIQRVELRDPGGTR